MRTIATTFATLAALSIAGSASATVNVSSQAFGLDAVPAGGTLIDFESPTLPAGFTLTGGLVRNFSDSLGAEPALSQGVQETSYYLSANSGDPATITSATGFRTLSFYWGSIDSYNTVTLLDQLGGTIQSFTGSDVSAQANGDQGDGSTNRRVTFTVDGTTSPIYGVRFAATQPAFETDNVAFAAPVPEPASWAMMIGGFGLVGGAMRRRRISTSVRYA